MKDVPGRRNNMSKEGQGGRSVWHVFKEESCLARAKCRRMCTEVSRQWEPLKVLQRTLLRLESSCGRFT